MGINERISIEKAKVNTTWESHLYNKRPSSLHTHTAQCAHRNTESRETEMQVWLKQHIPLIFPFPADAGTFKCYRGSCSEHAAHFHPHPPQPCTFLPRQQGGQVFCTEHTHPCCYRQSCCSVSGITTQLHGRGLQTHLTEMFVFKLLSRELSLLFLVIGFLILDHFWTSDWLEGQFTP